MRAARVFERLLIAAVEMTVAAIGVRSYRSPSEDGLFKRLLSFAMAPQTRQSTAPGELESGSAFGRIGDGRVGQHVAV